MILLYQMNANLVRIIRDYFSKTDPKLLNSVGSKKKKAKSESFRPLTELNH